MENYRDENTGRFKRGEKPHNFKGQYKSKEGYVFIYCPEHPNASGRGKYVMEHRLVMEAHLGRYLTREEQVHHINDVRDDNRIENLKLCADNSEHREIHRKKWYKEKPCTICEQVKPLSAFYMRWNSPKSKHRYKHPTSWCKECSRAKKKASQPHHKPAINSPST